MSKIVIVYVNQNKDIYFFQTKIKYGSTTLYSDKKSFLKSINKQIK